VGLLAMLVLAACGSKSTEGQTDRCNPCKTFVTQSMFTGDLITEEGSGMANGIMAADALCMADANYTNEAGGVGIYLALIVDGTNRVACTSGNCITGGSSEHVNWVLHKNTAYYRSDGKTLVMTTNQNGIYDFGSGDLPASFAGGVINYWTGFSFPAWTTGRHCSAWTSSSNAGGNANIGDAGRSDQVGIEAISGPSNLCSANPWAGLLCVEQ